MIGEQTRAQSAVRPRPRLGRGLVLSALLCLMTAGVSAVDRPGDHVGFFVAAYGLADPAVKPRVARAHAVFERVRAAAAIQGRRLPRLKILDARTDPWALSLPDGYILLSSGAVDICYRDADDALGDARLAFVLGHELAHLAKDDFWHGEVYHALAGDPGAKASLDLLAETSDANPERHAETRLKEAQADDRGFVYAAVAGYPVQRLVGSTDARKDFFEYWVEQTQVLADPAHPAPADRAALLRNRLARMLGDIELWRFGVRLLHAGRLDDARHFLEAFQAAFPSREVFGNLGVLYLRKALERLPVHQAYRYWLPLVLDLDTRAEGLKGATTRGNAELDSQTLALLESAAEYLDRAVELDPDYAPAWSNLAVTRHLLGQGLLARHAQQRAAAGAPQDIELRAFGAVLLAEADPTLDLWPQATARLDALLETHPEVAAVRYNLARLLDKRGRGAAAEPHWSWLRAHAERLPAAYAALVCADRDGRHPQCPLLQTTDASPIPWKLPATPGADLFEDKALQAALNSDAWQRRPVEFGTKRMHGAIHWQPDRAAVLILDGYVDTIALYGPDLGSAAGLRARAGEPRSVQSVPGAEIWSYTGWSAVIRDGQVAEAWVTRPSP